MKQARILFLLNAKSRRGQEMGAQLRKLLGDAGLELVNSEDIPIEKFTQAILDHADRIDGVVVAGGDGSMNAALAGLLKTELPLGVVPLGTSNNLARNLGLPLEAEGAVAVIAAGHQRTVDLGVVNNHPFFVVAGMGLSIRVNSEVPAERKRRWGMFAYIATAAQNYKNYHRFRAEITADGGRHLCVRSYQISVCNGQHFGSGLTVAEVAGMSDGKLHLCSVQAEKWTDLPRVIFGVKTGRHASNGPTLLLESSEFSIKTPKKMKIDVDGEITTETPALFRVYRNAVRVFSIDPQGTPVPKAN